MRRCRQFGRRPRPSTVEPCALPRAPTAPAAAKSRLVRRIWSPRRSRPRARRRRGGAGCARSPDWGPGCGRRCEEAGRADGATKTLDKAGAAGQQRQARRAGGPAGPGRFPDAGGAGLAAAEAAPGLSAAGNRAAPGEAAGAALARLTALPAILIAAWLLPGLPLLLGGSFLPVPMLLISVPLAAALTVNGLREVPASWPRSGAARALPARGWPAWFGLLATVGDRDRADRLADPGELAVGDGAACGRHVPAGRLLGRTARRPADLAAGGRLRRSPPGPGLRQQRVPQPRQRRCSRR